MKVEKNLSLFSSIMLRKLRLRHKNGFIKKITCSGYGFEPCCSHLINKCSNDKTNNMQPSEIFM